MTYEECLAKIHAFDKFGSRLGLERMRELLRRLGNPEKTQKVIHVAGTNGKGSTCRYLYCMLLEAGYHVGLYTSPYLERFTERIEYDGAEISHEDLCEATEVVLAKTEEMIAEGWDSPTEFEVVTAIHFWYLAQRPCDYLVLEVGMGGRGDSTNVMEKVLCSIVCSITWDHMQVLGDTLEKIAMEKAGIIKEGCPVVSHVKDPGETLIHAVAIQKHCEYYDLRKEEVTDVVRSTAGYGFTVPYRGKPLAVELSMIGMHQIENAKCAIKAIEIMAEKGQVDITTDQIKRGLRKAVQRGRLEILQREDPTIVIDGAHNDDGVRSLVAAVKENFAGKKILLVVGILADKEVDAMLAQFLSIGCDVAATEPDNPRRLTSKQLAEHVRALGGTAVDAGLYDTACRYAMEQRPNYDVILFSGSLYLIGKIRETLVRDYLTGIR